MAFIFYNMSIANLKKKLRRLGNKEKAKFLQRFFKSGKGEYAEGDVLIGVSVPQSRKLAEEFKDLSLEEVEELFHSKIHEERLVALVILVSQFRRGDEKIRKKIFEIYLKNIAKNVNNWDLVDLSASNIVGAYLANKPRDILRKLVRSNNLWEKRVSIVATFYFIVKQQQAKDTYQLAEMLLGDKHDLIHKAVGWMLREAGKNVSKKELIGFLDVYSGSMPRTMLRYSIEHFSPREKKYYMKKRERLTF